MRLSLQMHSFYGRNGRQLLVCLSTATWWREGQGNPRAMCCYMHHPMSMRETLRSRVPDHPSLQARSKRTATADLLGVGSGQCQHPGSGRRGHRARCHAEAQGHGRLGVDAAAQRLPQVALPSC